MTTRDRTPGPPTREEWIATIAILLLLVIVMLLAGGQDVTTA